MLVRRPMLGRPYVQNALVGVALLISLYMLAPPTSPVLSGAQVFSFLRQEKTGAVEAMSATDPLALPTTTKARRKPVAAKGIIMTGYTAGGPRFDDLVGLIDRTELNAVVLDIKDERGELSWVPRLPQARLAGAGLPKILDPRALVRKLHRKHIYVIGRICTFQDPILATVRPDLAIQDTHGGTWKTRKGLAWLDPYSTEAQDYNISLAIEAIDLGFDEIQFDYVRFPTDGDTTRMWHRFKDERLPQQVIAEFLGRARRQIVPRGAYISSDMFGLTALVADDLGIGQKVEMMAREVDYVSLMLYPSHFNKPEYGVDDPEKDPGKIVSLSLRDAKRRIRGTGAKLRPWLQDFSIQVPYTPVEVLAQIQAAENLGIHQWLLWNAANRYTEDALRATTRLPPPEPETTP
jgi:hypothetical protein